MNKKRNLKLLLVLSLFLISCGQKEDIYKSNKDTQISIEKGENNAKQDTNTPEVFIVAGGTNKVPEICEYYLSELNVTSKIKPSMDNNDSSYYEVESNENILIDVIFNVCSLRNEAKMADDIITTKIKINNNEYSSFPLVESTDGTCFEENALIDSQETRNIHYVSEVPIADSTGQLEIILTINGKDFSNKFNLDGTENSEENTQSQAKEGLTEEEYYKIIKEAKERQEDYINSINSINSINDPQVKESVQTANSAAIAESTALYIQYPEDVDTIDAALERVLTGE